MWGKKIEYKHKWMCSVVVEEVTREKELQVRIPPVRSARKMQRLATWAERAGGWAVGSLPNQNNYFAVFKISFFVFLKKYLPSVFWHRAKSLCRVPEKQHTPLCRCLYAVGALSCVTHHKDFAVWISAFAMCLWDMANYAISVVYVSHLAIEPSCPGGPLSFCSNARLIWHFRFLDGFYNAVWGLRDLLLSLKSWSNGLKCHLLLLFGIIWMIWSVDSHGCLLWD